MALNRTYIILILVCTFSTALSQIKSGLYTRNTWYVTVKDDTAISEAISMKTGYAWRHPDSEDTLYMKNDSSYIGNRYCLKMEKNKLYLINIDSSRKRRKHIALHTVREKEKQYWDEARNLVILTDLTHKYPKLYQAIYNGVKGEEANKIREAYWNLEGILLSKQEPFLQEVKKFENTFLR